MSSRSIFQTGGRCLRRCRDDDFKELVTDGKDRIDQTKLCHTRVGIALPQTEHGLERGGAVETFSGDDKLAKTKWDHGRRLVDWGGEGNGVVWLLDPR